ncbi:rCG53143 [Rattus norvegicus]|uniref:RCG53143 n=1 Tax=Rattus norvegicus TaxID=10116 RepID=A6JML4_RAT|nr:rCG53143 [Rattus norvegicus]
MRSWKRKTLETKSSCSTQTAQSAMAQLRPTGSLSKPSSLKRVSSWPPTSRIVGIGLIRKVQGKQYSP